jgi:hypothetical protein
VREHVTRDAYSDSDFRVVAGSTRKPRRQREPYVGPTRVGWWISEPDTAEGLAELLASATVALEALRSTEGDG